MSYIVTVTKSSLPREVTASEVSAREPAGSECFKQEFPEENFNLSKFVTALNKPVRVRKARTVKPTA